MLVLASPAGATFSSGGCSEERSGSGEWLESGGCSGNWSGFGDSLGISLRELTDGTDGSFSSLDGSFSFSGFKAGVNGLALRNLDLYRVVPLEDGFELLAPMGAMFGSRAELELSYEVTANEQAGEELLIEAMSMSILGTAVGSEASLRAMAQLFDPLDPDPQAPPVETLWLEVASLCGDGNAHDAVELGKPLETLSIGEVLAVVSGGHDDGDHHFGGFALGALVTHHFSVEPFAVPEPATVLTLGGGLAGLVVLGQRRRRRQGLRR